MPAAGRSFTPRENAYTESARHFPSIASMSPVFSGHDSPLPHNCCGMVLVREGNATVGVYFFSEALCCRSLSKTNIWALVSSLTSFKLQPKKCPPTMASLESYSDGSSEVCDLGQVTRAHVTSCVDGCVYKMIRMKSNGEKEGKKKNI